MSVSYLFQYYPLIILQNKSKGMWVILISFTDGGPTLSKFKWFTVDFLVYLLQILQQYITYSLLKSVRIRNFSGPYFPSSGLNTEKYGVSLRIWFECGKMRIGRTPNMNTFHAVTDNALSWCICLSFLGRTQYPKKVCQICQINLPRDKSDQKQVFTLETSNELSFPSFWEAFTTYPLTLLCEISPCC